MSATTPGTISATKPTETPRYTSARPAGFHRKYFPEWTIFEKLLHSLDDSAEILNLGQSQNSEHSFPLLAVKFGSKTPTDPTLIVFGGVHGLERIGAQVALAQLQSFAKLLQWDDLLKQQLQKIRVIFFPMINPIGILKKTRANPAGIDLMRNSPIEAEPASLFVGGHRLTPWLPWYRGPSQSPMQPESQAVVKLFEQEALQSKAVITLDLHSGFGLHDRIWFPWAKSHDPFPHLAETYSFKKLLDQTYPHHFYVIEPQALNYTTHGDLWDYTYSLYYKNRPMNQIYLPLTLEMGSWLWVRKNPLQLFSMLGPFNPVKPHRLKRILRRHNTFFDFLMRSLINSSSWADLSEEQKLKYTNLAHSHWYPREESAYVAEE